MAIAGAQLDAFLSPFTNSVGKLPNQHDQSGEKETLGSDVVAGGIVRTYNRSPKLPRAGSNRRFLVDIRDDWRTAIGNIADRNGELEPLGPQLATPIRSDDESDTEWIEKLNAWQAEVSQRIQDENGRWQFHCQFPDDVRRLTDCVVVFIWGLLNRYVKQTKYITHAPNSDPFLGVCDLEVYLQKQGYARLVIDEFVDSLFNQQLILPTPERPVGELLSGDLRFWLVKHRYSSHDVDLHLHREDAEATGELDPPPELFSEIQNKDAEAKAPRRAEWVRQRRQELLEQTRRKMPRSILAWGKVIARELACGTCNCSAQYPDKTAGSRLAGDALRRCKACHFLSRGNVDRAFRGITKQTWKYPIRDILEFVERAVVWKSSRIPRRGGDKPFQVFNGDFFKTMLANHFITPNDGKLVWGFVRVEEVVKGKKTGRIVEIETMIDTAGPVLTPTADTVCSTPVNETLICMRCAECGDAFVGDPSSVATCRRKGHVWVIGHMPRIDDDGTEAEGDSFHIPFAVCQRRHAWPTKKGKGNSFMCPLCGVPALEEVTGLKEYNLTEPHIFVPTNRSIDDCCWPD